MINEVAEAEVSRWIEQFDNTPDDRERAASELVRIGIFTRRSVRSRGSLIVAAQNRLPQRGKLPNLLKSLHSSDRAVRCQVALALGEWGGEEVATPLVNTLMSDHDEQVKLYCITALRTVGGPTVAAALAEVAVNSSDRIRSAALEALEELATAGGRVEESERPPAPAKAKVMRSFAVLAKPGTGRRARRRDAVHKVVTALERLRSDGSAPRLLRDRADDILEYVRG